VFTARYELKRLFVFTFHRPVPWLWWVAAGISSRRSGFGLRSVHARFMVDKVGLGQVFLQVHRFYPVSIIPPILHTLSCTCFFYEKDKLAKHRKLPKIAALLEIGENCRENAFTCCSHGIKLMNRICRRCMIF